MIEEKTENENRERDKCTLQKLYVHWKQNGVPEDDAKRYVKWYFKFRTYERKEK